MTRVARRIRRLRGDARGATLLEFGLIAPVLIIVLLGLFDMGYQSYAKSIMAGTLYKAARRATTGNFTSAQIDSYVNDQLTRFTRRGTVDIEKRSFYEFSGVKTLEKITQDTAPIGSYNPGDCFEDANRNNVRDGITGGGASGLGGSDDIIYYKVTLTFPRLFPLYRLLGWTSSVSVAENTVLRNQPFASQVPPPIIKVNSSGTPSAC